MIKLDNYHGINSSFLNKKVGVYCFEEKKLQEVLLELSGINKNENIFLEENNELVFDNQYYFSSRIYLDNNLQYLKTLIVGNIERALEQYSKIINKEKFKSLIKNLKVRLEGKFTNEYHFNELGKLLSNLAFILSVYTYKIIKYPLENLPLDKLDIIKEELSKEKQYILGIKNLSLYQDLVDEILIIGDDYYLLNKDDNIVVIEKKDMDISLQNYIYEFDEKVMLIGDSKNLKILQDKGIKYQEISIFEVENYEKN